MFKKIKEFVLSFLKGPKVREFWIMAVYAFLLLAYLLIVRRNLVVKYPQIIWLFLVLGFWFLFDNYVKKKELVKLKIWYWIDVPVYNALICLIIYLTGGYLSHLRVMFFLIAVSTPLFAPLRISIVAISLSALVYLFYFFLSPLAKDFPTLGNAILEAASLPMISAIIGTSVTLAEKKTEDEKRVSGELRKAKEALDIALKDIQMRFKDMIEAMIEGFYTEDEKGNFSYINKKMTEIYGYEEKEILEKPFLKFISAKSLEEAKKMLKEAERACIIPGLLELAIRRKDGKEIVIQVSRCPIIINEHIAGYQGVVRDVTLERKFREEMERKNKELEKATQDLKERTEVLERTLKVLEGREVEIMKYKKQIKELEEKMKGVSEYLAGLKL